MEDKKKYNYMETVLININSKYISLSEVEVKRNNKVLEEVLKKITDNMEEKDTTFKYMYSRVFYGGSYYDGLRVGNPEEFDLDLLMKIPKYTQPTLFNSDLPGFLTVQLKGFDNWEKQPEAHRFPYLKKLVDDKKYLVTSSVSQWIEGIVRKALNDFPQEGARTVIPTSSGKFYATIHKGGPAHTLKLSGRVNGKEVNMDIDLVPCFEFTSEKWPGESYRKNPVPSKPNFFIVPKKPGSGGSLLPADKYWRLSFQEQERELINGLRTLKPTCKLIKRMRDVLDHKAVASYYIKTVFLWELEKNKEMWNNSLSYVLMQMLKKYKEYLENKEIPYYWNKENNLLEKTGAVTLQNIANRLQAVINDIERHPDDPYVIAKYLEGNSRVSSSKQDLKPRVVVLENSNNKENIFEEGVASVGIAANEITTSRETSQWCLLM